MIRQPPLRTPRNPVDRAQGSSTVNSGDISKLYGEINQLRNQQFLITLAALTFFGVIVAWLLPDENAIGGRGEIKILGSITFSIVLGFLVVLLVLFFWIRRLTTMIAIISVYLEETHLSAWEPRYNEFSKRSAGRETQRGTMALVFLALGVFGALMPAILAFGRNHSVEWDGWWIVLSFCLAIYVVLVGTLGFGSNEHRRESIRSRWREVLGKTK